MGATPIQLNQPHPNVAGAVPRLARVHNQTLLPNPPLHQHPPPDRDRRMSRHAGRDGHLSPRGDALHEADIVEHDAPRLPTSVETSRTYRQKYGRFRNHGSALVAPWVSHGKGKRDTPPRPKRQHAPLCGIPNETIHRDPAPENVSAATIPQQAHRPLIARPQARGCGGYRQASPND